MTFLYVLAIVREFRWTLAALAFAVLLGTILFWVIPQDGARPPLHVALYAGWMALLAQPIYNPPQAAALKILCALYPLLGAVLIGEGIVRLAMLMMSKRRGEREWTKVMVSTYRDHVVLCGLGHLGCRVLEQLVASDIPVVVLERHRKGRFITRARELKVPLLIRDMKEDQALIDAGIKHARAVIICTNDAMANLEVALDSRRMNPKIRVIMRLFDEQIADKLSGAMSVDVAFSSSSLAAPVVAALALAGNGPATRILSSVSIDGVTHVAVEMIVQESDWLCGQPIESIETKHGVRVLSHAPAATKKHAPPTPKTPVTSGDKLIVHTPASRIAALTQSHP